MIYVVICPHCLHTVGVTPPTGPKDKAQCSHCDELIDPHGGRFIKEPAEPEKEFDLLSVE